MLQHTDTSSCSTHIQGEMHIYSTNMHHNSHAHRCTNTPSDSYLCTLIHTQSLCTRSVAGTHKVYSDSHTHKPHILTVGGWERTKPCQRLVFIFIFAKSQHVSLATREREKKAPKTIKIQQASLKSAFPRLFDTEKGSTGICVSLYCMCMCLHVLCMCVRQSRCVFLCMWEWGESGVERSSGEKCGGFLLFGDAKEGEVDGWQRGK